MPSLKLISELCFVVGVSLPYNRRNKDNEYSKSDDDSVIYSNKLANIRLNTDKTIPQLKVTAEKPAHSEKRSESSYSGLCLLGL